MSKNSYSVFYIIILLFFGCKTINLQEDLQTATSLPLVLGNIGLNKDFILQKGFKNSAYPKYTNPIKLSITKIPFTKTIYKKFLKAKEQQSSNIDIKYIDSITEKPYYLKLTIADKVELVSNLNNYANNNVNSYLKLDPYAKIITGISIGFNNQELQMLEQALSVYLIETTLKTYALRLHTIDNKTTIIPFKKGVVFMYKSSNLCWKENSKRRLEIVDIVGEYNNCAKGSYRSASKAKQKINYYKL